jgi:hypothetical protein
MNLVRKWLFILIGLGLLAAAIPVTLSTRAFVRKAERVPGVVVSLFAGGSHPNIEFTTKSGKKITFNKGGMFSSYKTGEKVQVLYDPSDPSTTARIDEFGAIWEATIFLLILGLGLFLLGVTQC